MPIVACLCLSSDPVRIQNVSMNRSWLGLGLQLGLGLVLALT